MDKHTITIVKSEPKHEDDVILVINDDYNNMDSCDYVMPIPETPVINYKVVKEEVKEPEFYNINYAI